MRLATRALVVFSLLGTLALGSPALAGPAVAVGPGSAEVTPARLVLDGSERVVVAPPRAPSPASSPKPAPAAVEVVTEEGFEGTFPPSLWEVRYGTQSPEAWWWQSSTRAKAGTRSVYCAGGGSQAPGAGGPYLPNMYTRLVYGPFSMSNASDATASFSYWLDVQPRVSDDNYPDELGWGISTDYNPGTGNGTFYGWRTAGRGQAWYDFSFNFSQVTEVAAAGQAQVFLAFWFASDASTQYEGAYVDALRITRTLRSCVPTCSGNVPATGVVGTPVTFQSVVTTPGCSGSPAISWDFGDRTPAGGGATVTHTYQAPGVFTWTLNVMVDGVPCQKTGTITVTEACRLDCTATVPGSGQVGVPVLFQATASPSGCTGSPGWLWSFGTGQPTSTSQSPSHTYTAAGTYHWSLNVTLQGTQCHKEGDIAITQAVTYTSFYWLPVVAHNPGASGSQWRTDLGLLNTGTETANVQLRLFAGGAPRLSSTQVGPGVQVILTDVVSQFGVNATGSLEVRSDRDLFVSSRTYNQTTSGTYGQGYDSYLTDQGASAGQVIYLPQLTQNASYRSNIAVTNTGAANATVKVELFDGTGSKVGEYTENLAAGGWRQESQAFFTKAGKNDLARGYARLTVQAGTGVVAYASVLDAVTSDPTTISAKRAPAGATTVWVPVVARTSGVGGSSWRTDLGVLNVGSATATVQLKLHGDTATSPQTLTLAPGAQAIEVDVESRFGASITGNASLEVVSDQPVIVTSRTYNQTPNGTYGQDYDAVATAQGASSGQSFFLPQLTENGAYRTNVGLTNTGTTAAKARVELFNGANVKVGEYPVDLNPGQMKQEPRPFYFKGSQSSMPRGYAKVTVTAGSGVVGFASVVDNVTSDPTTVVMKGSASSVTQTGLVTGTVATTSGTLVPGATVTIGSVTTTSNEQGWFSLGSVPATTQGVVTVAKTGYVSGAEITKVVTGESHTLDLVVAPVERTGTVAATAGGTVTTTDGGLVTIPAGGLVTPTGQTFTGDANVAVTTFDPSVPGELTAFPGDFQGVTRTGQTVDFNTFGFIDVTVTSSTGPLQLRPGQTATVEVPIPAVLRDTAPPSMPSWYFDPADGKWHEEGTFTRVGNVYRTTVPHFSVWNCDVAAARCYVTGRVVDSEGNPVKGARVEFRSYRGSGGGFVSSGETSTPDDGTFRVPVDANADIEYWAKKGTIESEHRTGRSCANQGTMTVGDIVLGGSSGTGKATISLSWLDNPGDLDAHLTVPRTDGTWGHVFYNNKSTDDATLDTDDRNGKGPELVTILKGHVGTYRYSVHHYGGSATISSSGAVVTVSAPGVGVRVFTAPPGATASKDLWRVFDLKYRSDGTFSLTPVGDIVPGVTDAYDVTKFIP